MRPIALCLATALLAAADAAPPPQPAADPVFEARPGRLAMTRYRHWQDDGGRSNDQREFEATIRFFAKGEATVLGWRDARVTEAVSDAGEALVADSGNGRNEGRVDSDMMRMRRQHGGGGGADFEVEFAFTWPTKPCNGIARISGTVTALVAAGAAKKAELKPYKDIVGKALEIGGIAGGEITVDKGENGDGVLLRYPKALEEKMLGVAFLDAAGRELPVRGWGGGSDGDGIERTYHVRMPDDGAIVVSLAPETRPVKVPFALTGMSMDDAGGKPRARVKVEAKDDVPAPAKPGAGGNLPVKPAGGGGNGF